MKISLRYVTVDNVRVACGITTQFISDSDMQELLEYMEFEIEQYINTRFLPYTIIEQYEGDESERLILKKSPVLKIREVTIDDTTIDVDNLRVDNNAGIIWLTTAASIGSFSRRTNERNLVRVKYDYGMLEVTTTQTTTDAAEVAGDSIVVAVASATGFSADDQIQIQGMDSKQEVCKITGISSNNITVDNLSVSHEAGSLVTLMRVPKAAERLMIVACAMAAVARVVGQSFDEITGYSIGDLQVQKGEPYTQWREVNMQLQKEYKLLLQHFPIRSAIA